MNHILSKSIIFIAGATIGSAVTWKIVKTKYERIAQEEIESVREVYSKHSSKSEAGEVEDAEEVIDSNEYREIAKIYKGNTSDSEEEEEDEDMFEPYVISPDEFDEEGYDTVTLYYHEDGVLVDQLTKEIIENVDELIGEDSLTHFGEYEDDSVFVRNDRLKTDFEILRVNERYEE